MSQWIYLNLYIDITRTNELKHLWCHLSYPNVKWKAGIFYFNIIYLNLYFYNNKYATIIKFRYTSTSSWHEPETNKTLMTSTLTWSKRTLFLHHFSGSTTACSTCDLILEEYFLHFFYICETKEFFYRIIIQQVTQDTHW
jgi:hypothetical protein